MASPERANADGILQVIRNSLVTFGLEEDTINKKLVSLGCDGASVMLGRKGGVGAKLKEQISWLLPVHCLAHRWLKIQNSTFNILYLLAYTDILKWNNLFDYYRLELAFRDCIKECASYKSTITLLMGLYYFFRNSPCMRKQLKNTFDAKNMKILIPARIGGTRWVSHMLLALNNFLGGYEAIIMHLENLKLQQQQTQVIFGETII